MNTEVIENNFIEKECFVDIKQLKIKSECVSIIHVQFPEEFFPLNLKNFDYLDAQNPPSKNDIQKQIDNTNLSEIPQFLTENVYFYEAMFNEK